MAVVKIVFAVCDLTSLGIYLRSSQTVKYLLGGFSLQHISDLIKNTFCDVLYVF